MADPFAKVSSGQKLRIPASAYNAMVDAAKDYAARKNSGGAVNSRVAPSNLIRVKNISGADSGRFAVLGIDGVIFEPGDTQDQFKNTIAFTANTPAAANHSQGRFVITAEPIANNAIGMAHASGLCRVQINVTEETHQFADITENDSTVLTSATDGPVTILWRESGTGNKWAIVRFGAIGGGNSFTWAQVMHEPDDQADYVPVKLDTWAPAWSGNSVEYFPQQSQPPRGADKVTYNNREYECIMHHRSTAYITPERPSYWKMVEPVKAYGWGITGPLSTACPQFSHGMMIPVLMYEDRYYIVGLFSQGGINAASFGAPSYYIPGSFGWIKQTSTNAGRAGSFYR